VFSVKQGAMLRAIPTHPFDDLERFAFELAGPLEGEQLIKTFLQKNSTSLRNASKGDVFLAFNRLLDRVFGTARDELEEELKGTVAPYYGYRRRVEILSGDFSIRGLCRVLNVSEHEVFNLAGSMLGFKELEKRSLILVRSEISDLVDTDDLRDRIDFQLVVARNADEVGYLLSKFQAPVVLIELDYGLDAGEFDDLFEFSASNKIPIICMSHRQFHSSLAGPAFAYLSAAASRDDGYWAVLEAFEGLFRNNSTTEQLHDAAQSTPAAALRPLAAPADFQVIAGRLELHHEGRPNAVLDVVLLEGRRKRLSRECDELLAGIVHSNVAVGFRRRLGYLAAELREDFTREVALAIGISADGLARLLPILERELLDLPAADFAEFIDQVQQFAEQFPEYRKYREEAARGGVLPADARSALGEVANAIVKLPDATVAPEAKDRLVVTVENVDGPQEALALTRVVANALRAIGRHTRRVALESGVDARGKLVKMLGTLIVGLPIAGAITLLGRVLPAEFAAAVTMIVAARAVVDGAEKKDEKD